MSTAALPQSATRQYHLREEPHPEGGTALGFWLYLGIGIGRGPGNGWMHAKLGAVLLVAGYHHACALLLRKFEKGQNQRSHQWLRCFNEVPVLLLLAIVVLVVVKPF